MQASRRSWRIGQRLPVKVVYFSYRKTLQETALRLMGAKVKATMALQGRFSSEGLTALCQGEDMMSALAKAIVDGVDGLESAETYWRNQRAAGKETLPPAAGAGAQNLVPTAAAPETELSLLDLFGELSPPSPRLRSPDPDPVTKEPAQLQLAF